MHAKEGVAVATTVTAIAAPMLVVHWMAVGQGIFAQMLAVLLWGLVLLAWAMLAHPVAVPWRALAPLLSALGLAGFGVALSAAMHRTPAGIWIGSLGVLAAAAAVAIAATRAARQWPEGATRALMWGVVLAAFVSLVVAVLQLAAPGWASPWWVAPVRTPGRASANIDQPNHLATLLLWAWLAVAAWSARGREPAAGAAREPTASRAPITVAAAPTAGGVALVLAFLLQAGVVATASRAGLLASMVLGLWAALDRRLPRLSAWVLWITALGGLVMTIGRALMTPAPSLGAGASLVRPGARGGVFVDSLELIREHALLGVGWMEFQLAWSLSPLGDRGPRYFDHAHNLVLNLMVELGVPLGLAITGALIWGAIALLLSLRRVAPAFQPRALMLAAMLAVIGLHSLFDAPFWYAYLLLPAAWAWGCLVGLAAGPDAGPDAGPHAAPHTAPVAVRDIVRDTVPDAAPNTAPAALTTAISEGIRAKPARIRIGLSAGGIVMACAAIAMWFDFCRLLPELHPGSPPAAAAQPRAAPAGTSRLFGYYGDQLRALGAPDAPADLFRSARWVWIDTQLLAAWIAALERAGRIDEARFLMQRAREFRDPAFAAWLAECRVVEPMQPPSRCRPPGRVPHWREFR